MMEKCFLSKTILILTILFCHQGVYAECEIPDASLKLKSKIRNTYVIGCKNETLVMTVGNVKTYRMDNLKYEMFICDDETFTTTIRGEERSITEAKCISRVTCNRPTTDGVDVTDTEKQLRYVGEKGDARFSVFADYTAGDRIDLKCAYGYGQPKGSCDADPNAFDYSLYETEEKLPSEGTFNCNDDGKWNNEPVIDCRKIVCNWTGNRAINNGRLVGLKDDEYLLDDTIQAVCNAGFKPTENAVCQSNGCFSKTTVSCEEIHCPRLDNYNNLEKGYIVYSNQPITVNSTATFYCDFGYERFGPDVLTCQQDGSWSDHDCITCQSLKYANEPPTLKSSCPAPCVPYGAIQKGFSYEIGDTVLFRCHNDFHYLGAANTITRVCLKNATWNGTDIRCTGLKNTEGLFLGETLESIVIRADQNFMEWKKNNRDQPQSRTINIYKSLQLYLLVDSSGSIKDEAFAMMKEFVKTLLEKVFGAKIDNAFPEVYLRFFAKTTSREYKFTNLFQFQSLNLTRADIKSMTGSDTNIPRALLTMRHDINTRKAVDEGKGYLPSRVLVVISDGQNNMGGGASIQDMIQELHHVVETYSIFVGKKESEIDSIDKYGHQLMRILASKNKNAQDEHLFRIICSNKDCVDGLKNIIEQMINTTADPIQCGEFSDLTNLNDEKDFESIKDAEEGAWPWMVKLENENGIHQCGATILNNNWILSAAHCDINDRWKIYIGRTSRLQGGGNYITTSMQKTTAHPQYNSVTFQYDLRVVKLANPVLYSRKKPYAAPVCLYNNTEFPGLKYEDLFKSWSRGVVTGWGANKTDGSPSETMRQIQLRIVEAVNCTTDATSFQQKRFNETVNFCAIGKGENNVKIDANKGDSGGPYVVQVEKLDSMKKRKRVFIQIGVVSWGSTRYGYYTRLTPEMIDWINKKISEN